MKKFKVGDRIVFITKAYDDMDNFYLKPATITGQRYDTGDIWFKLDNTVSAKRVRPGEWHLSESKLLEVSVPEDVFNSPLYKALREENE